jgi:hypothetical protein
MNSGKNLSRSKLIIVVQICAVVMKNVSGTKMIILTNCEKSEEMRGLSAGGVYQRTICYTPCIAESSFRTTR